MADERFQIGSRIRNLRRRQGKSQALMASAVGVSASYLNLIEHNRRRLTVDLLFKVAGYLGVEVGELAAEDDARLASDMLELFSDELFADADLTNQDIRDLAASNPAVARATQRLFAAYRRVSEGRSGQDTEPPAGDSADTVSDFLQQHQNHFPELEAAAERIRDDIDRSSETFDEGLRGYLLNAFGMEWRSASLPHGVALRVEQQGRALSVSDILPAESALFGVCRQIGLMGASREIEAIIRDEKFAQPDAPALARNVLAAYFAGALIMPYEEFFALCRATRYDIERVGRRFRTSFEQVCHRMTTLQREGARGIPFHLVRTDIAGNISKRFSLSGIQIPRYSGACPRWNIYGAFLRPGDINIQVSQMPDGCQYFCIAKAVAKGGYRHHAPRSYLSIGLGCELSEAGGMVYSDGIDLENPAAVVPVGVGCRMCPRRECEQRALPPIGHRFSFSDVERQERVYGHLGDDHI